MSKATGLDSFFDVLAVVKDPKKFEAKALELQKMIDEYKVVIEAVVELSKVNDYTNSIRSREEESKKLLGDSKQTATNIIADATFKSNQLKKEAEDLKAGLKAKIYEYDSLVVTVRKQQEELDKELIQVKQNSEALAKKETQLLKQEQDLKERKAKLLSAMS